MRLPGPSSLGGPRPPWSARIGAAGALTLALSVTAPTAGTEVIPIEEIVPGQRGVAETVFEGNTPEPFELEVLGIARNSLGPGRDLIIVRLLGERVEHTGVVAGMSGSPVLIDGRLAGVFSFRIGTFSREPIAGVTPFRYMKEIPSGVGEAPAEAAEPASRFRLSRDRSADEELLVTPPPPASAGAGETRPIVAPIQVGGADPSLLERLGPTFRESGWVALAAGGGGGTASGGKATLHPGDAVGAQLMRGDLSLTGTGTVTAVEGNRVWAFGHPFLRAGRGELPMTTVEIVATVPSDFNSFKLGNAGPAVGVFDEDRFSGIAGTLGIEPHLIPVKVDLQPEGGAAVHYSYEVVDHPDWTPFLVQTAVLNSLFFDLSFGSDVTLKMTTAIEIEGHESTRFHEAYARTGTGPAPAFAAASDAGRLTAALIANRFERARLAGVEVQVEIAAERRYAVVVDVQPSRVRVRPGESIELQVTLEPYRGERSIRKVTLPVPADLPAGPLEIVAGGAGALDLFEARTIQAVQAQLPDLASTIRFLNDLRASDQLHVRAYRATNGMILDGRLLPDLPRTVHQILSADEPARSLTRLDRRAVSTVSVPWTGPVLGAHLVTVEVIDGAPRQEGGLP